jgi:lipopolysaccharide export LptBFGC system permease protein LptF
MIPIWFKDLSRSLIRSFVTLTLIFYACFFLIDLSSSAPLIWKKTGTLSPLFSYLIHHAILFADYLLPICFIMASIQILLRKNQSHELSSLQMAGLSKGKIFLPFFVIGSFLSLGSAAINEWLVPLADKEIQTSFKKGNKKPLYYALLPDHSTLVYGKEKKGLLEDIFWIQSFDDIWHFEKIDLRAALAEEGFHFHRTDKLLQLQEILPTLTLPFTEKELIKVNFQNELPLSSLWQFMHEKAIPEHMKRPLICAWHRKWLKSVLGLIGLFAVFPFCLSFSRQKSKTLIYVATLFFFVTFHMIMESILILMENSTQEPLMIWIPVIVCVLFSFLFYFPRRGQKKSLQQISSHIH